MKALSAKSRAGVGALDINGDETRMASAWISAHISLNAGGPVEEKEEKEEHCRRRPASCGRRRLESLG